MRAFLLLSSLCLTACIPGITTPSGIHWETEVVSGEGTDFPRSAIMLKDGSEMLFTAECDGIADEVDSDEHEGGSVMRCWLPGGGNEFGARAEADGSLTVERRTVDEEGGFGEWKRVRALR